LSAVALACFSAGAGAAGALDTAAGLLKLNAGAAASDGAAAAVNDGAAAAANDGAAAAVNGEAVGPPAGAKAKVLLAAGAAPNRPPPPAGAAGAAPNSPPLAAAGAGANGEAGVLAASGLAAAGPPKEKPPGAAGAGEAAGAAEPTDEARNEFCLNPVKPTLTSLDPILLSSWPSSP